MSTFAGDLHYPSHPPISKTKNGKISLLSAVCAQKDIETIRQILQNEPKSIRKKHNGKNIVHIAIENKCSSDVIQYLILKRPKALKERTFFGYMLPLHILLASSSKQQHHQSNGDDSMLDLIQEMIHQYPRALLKECSKEGRTALHIACEQKKPCLNIIRLLVKNGNYYGKKNALAHKRTCHGYTPFHSACCVVDDTSLDVLEYLYNLYPNVIRTKVKGGNFPLHLACISSHHRHHFENKEQSKNIIKFLISCYPKALDIRNHIQEGHTTPIRMVCEILESSHGFIRLIKDCLPCSVFEINDSSWIWSTAHDIYVHLSPHALEEANNNNENDEDSDDSDDDHYDEEEKLDMEQMALKIIKAFLTTSLNPRVVKDYIVIFVQMLTKAQTIIHDNNDNNNNNNNKNNNNRHKRRDHRFQQKERMKVIIKKIENEDKDWRIDVLLYMLECYPLAILPLDMDIVLVPKMFDVLIHERNEKMGNDDDDDSDDDESKESKCSLSTIFTMTRGLIGYGLFPQPSSGTMETNEKQKLTNEKKVKMWWFLFLFLLVPSSLFMLKRGI